MARRKSIHIKGMEHGAPIPNGVVIGNMIFSSAISGKDAKTGVLSSDPDEQAEAMFRNLRLFMSLPEFFFDRVTAEILPENLQMIEICRLLGFRLEPDQDQIHAVLDLVL